MVLVLLGKAIGSSLRRAAELLCSLLGWQERWWLWRGAAAGPKEQGLCPLHYSIIHRWLA